MRIDPNQHAQLQTSRIELFQLEPRHVTAEYVSWLNDPETRRYMESRFTEHTLDSTVDFVHAMLASPSDLLLGIHSRELGRHVGNIRLGHIHPHHRTGEIGILVGDRNAWGKGIASTAIATISGLARDQLSLRKLTAGCYASNVGSQRAFEKAGFFVEAVRKHQCLLDGEPADIVLMGRFLQ
jgi:RimJ/RimL family protein N-acetyltransferase